MNAMKKTQFDEDNALQPSSQAVRKYPRNKHLPPGPQTYQVLNAGSFQHHPIETFGHLWKTYGDLVHLPFLPGQRTLLASHPTHAERMLVTHMERYRKSALFVNNLRLVQGKGLVTSDGDLWQRHRRLMQPAFHQKHISRLHQVILDCVESLLNEWSQKMDGAVIDIAAEMTQLTLKIVSLALFSVDISDDSSALGKACRHAIEYVHYRMSTPLVLPAFLPTPRNRQFWQAKRTIDQVVQTLIHTRCQSATESFDLLSLLLAARDEAMETGNGAVERKKEGFSDRQLQDEVITLINAGHETSATVLAWIWVLLGQHPDVMVRLSQEIDQVLHGEQITPTTVSQLTYTRQVIDESLRLCPPGFGLVREAAEDDEIDGYWIPKGSTCIIASYHMFRHPDVWDNPDTFNPQRFSPDRANERHKFAYFPFGAGPHICIGKSFALMELVTILATIVQRFRVEVIHPQSFEVDPRFTLRPKYGVKVRLHHR